jgi:hypothetical protein
LESSRLGKIRGCQRAVFWSAGMLQCAVYGMWRSLCVGKGTEG